jgi:hypothetical protein
VAAEISCMAGHGLRRGLAILVAVDSRTSPTRANLH